MALKDFKFTVTLNPPEIAAIVHERDRYLSALGSVKDQVDSLAFAAPEMTAFWMNEILTTINQALAGES